VKRARKGQSTSRRNRRRGRRGVTLLSLGALVLALLGGFYLVAESGVFSLRSVEFRGNTQLSRRDLMTLMGVEMGENLLKLPAREMAGYLEHSPWVRDAKLRKEYPDRLIVKVEESVPHALLRNSRGLFLLDEEGRVLEKLAGEPPAFLPVIVDASGRKEGAFAEALALASAVRDMGLLREKESVEIAGFEHGAEGMTMRVDGMQVRMGQGMYAEKLARLMELSPEIRRRAEKVQYVDLRFKDRVVVKPAGAGARP
jgi:cell division protein FtsQ